MEIRHRKIYQEDLEWRALQDYVKELQKLIKHFAELRSWPDFVDVGNEVRAWFKWFGIFQNQHDTDWAVDPITNERI